MRCHIPVMTKRIGKHAGAIAVKLVFDRLYLFGSCCKGIGKYFVNIGDIKMEAYWRAADGLRAFCATFRTFIGQHDDRIVNFDFSMGDFAIWRWQAHPYGCTEYIFVKFNGFGRALNN